MLKTLLVLLISVNCYATQEQDAINAAARAFYEQQHWNDDVNAFLQHYEKRLTKRQKQWGGYVYEIANIINRQEIRFIWRFP